MEKIEFNTRRQYTHQGQPITAVKQGNQVWFQDHARMIIGTFTTALDDDKLTDRLVMDAYDNGHYKWAGSLPK